MKQKKYLMVGDYMLDKILEKIKEIIGVEKLNNTKILIDRDDRLTDNITLENFVILMTCFIKDNDRFYPQLFLEEAIFLK